MECGQKEDTSKKTMFRKAESCCEKIFWSNDTTDKTFGLKPEHVFGAI